MIQIIFKIHVEVCHSIINQFILSSALKYQISVRKYHFNNQFITVNFILKVNLCHQLVILHSSTYPLVRTMFYSNRPAIPSCRLDINQCLAMVRLH